MKLATAGDTPKRRRSAESDGVESSLEPMGAAAILPSSLTAANGPVMADAMTAVLKVLGTVKPRPSECRQFVRKRLAEALPGICDRLIKQCAAGDVAALKLLWKLGELHESSVGPTSSGGRRRVAMSADSVRRNELDLTRKTLAAFHAQNENDGESSSATAPDQA